MIYLEAQNKNLKIVKIYICFICILIMIAIIGTQNVYGQSNVTFITDPPYKLIMENGEGSRAVFDIESEINPEGNMTFYKNGYEVDQNGIDTGMWELVTDDSNKFVFSPLDKRSFNDFYLKIKGGSQGDKGLAVKNAEKVEVFTNMIRIVGEKGSTCEYDVGQYSQKSKLYYNAEGYIIGTVSMYEQHGLTYLAGAQGKTVITLCSDKSNNKVVAESRYYCFGKKMRIEKKGTRVKATNGVCLPDKTTRLVTSLYLRPTNKGKNMLLTWNKVKGAKSYIVYRYSPEKNRYVAAAVRNGQSANYYNISKAAAGKKYRYKIVAKTKYDGKGKKVCKESYEVTAVARGSSITNAGKVTTNRRTITGKAGKQIILKAKVKTTKGQAEPSKDNGEPQKQLLSESIRWHTSDSKIATVGKNSGKVRLKKKGKCLIWAKAHNGRNSKPIKVVVK